MRHFATSWRLAGLLLSLGWLPAAAQAELSGADWPAFRGDGRNVADDAKLPVTWSVETGDNIAWTADLPGRGVSSPIVVDGRIIVTCSSGAREDRLHVLAFDAETGKQLWHRQFWATGRTLFEMTSAVAANTPASDGQRIFAFFSSNDLIALDLDGNVQWIRDLTSAYPRAGNDVGMASSPAVVDGAVIVQSEGQGDAFVAAFDASDGALRWQKELRKQAGWSSPIGLRQQIDGHEVDAVVIQTAGNLDVVRADTGERIWNLEIPCNSIASPVFDEQLFVTAGGLTAIDCNTAGAKPKPGWKESRLQATSCSPVIYDGWAYTMNRGGVLNCCKVGENDIAWKKRVGGDCWATPLAANGRLYCFDSDGKAFVIDLNDKGKIDAKIDMGEAIYGSPAVSGDAMYVRSHGHLWKIAEK